MQKQRHAPTSKEGQWSWKYLDDVPEASGYCEHWQLLSLGRGEWYKTNCSILQCSDCSRFVWMSPVGRWGNQVCNAWNVAFLFSKHVTLYSYWWNAVEVRLATHLVETRSGNYRQAYLYIHGQLLMIIHSWPQKCANRYSLITLIIVNRF